jgi:hypothetical protein
LVIQRSHLFTCGYTLLIPRSALSNVVKRGLKRVIRCRLWLHNVSTLRQTEAYPYDFSFRAAIHTYHIAVQRMQRYPPHKLLIRIVALLLTLLLIAQQQV